jgi:lipoprotein-anchoring transpeptidase ErfK/SrfK
MTMDRRVLLGWIATSLLPLGACTTAGGRSAPAASDPESGALMGVDYAAPLYNEPYFVPGVRTGTLPVKFQRQLVADRSGEAPGTIVVRTNQHFLYLVQPGGKAIRYGIAIGREGFSWKGRAVVGAKRKWPDWHPPKEMIERDPRLRIFAGAPGGMAGGTDNPIGARALYLYQNGRDTLYRIHGTTDASSIGSAATSGCVRMLNVDVIDLYERAPVGAQVIVL